MSCKRRAFITALIFCGLVLTGCSEPGNTTAQQSITGDANLIPGAEADSKNKDGRVDLSTLSGVIRIDKEGEYILTGALSDGQLLIETDKSERVTLILDGCSINCSTGAAIYVRSTDRLTIETAEGSENYISSEGKFIQTDENKVDAAIFSKDDIRFEGDGRLTVTSAANGISAKDDLTIKGGDLSVTALGHAIEVNDTLELEGGALTLKAGKDALRAENSDDAASGIIIVSGGEYDITSDGDGIYASGAITVSGGKLKLVCGGGSTEPKSDMGGFGGFGWSSQTTADDSVSAKGIKATGAISITGGELTVDSADDSLHSNADVTISGGALSLSSTDDAVHADAKLTVKGGTIDITRSYEGLEGLSVEIEGGDITLVSSDDGINAAGGNDQSGFGGFRGRDNFAAGGSSDSYITISGGIVRVDARGDGIDSNSSLTISGGEVYVDGPTSSGNGALDYDGNGSVSGGIVVAVGASGMAQGFGSASTQPSFTVNLGNVSGKLTLTDSSGRVLVEYEPGKSYQCAVISHPELKVGESYTVTVGTSKTVVELTGIVTGGSGGFGGFGGRPGGFGGRG